MLDKPSDTTRQRLISVAGEIFAERGFEAATIREISGRAATNVAAIHYHFRDKQGLYRATVEAAQESYVAWDPFPDAQGLTPVDSLRSFVGHLLTQVPNPRVPRWHFSLMRRELLDPTSECRPLVEAFVLPLTHALHDVLKQLLPSSLAEPDRRLVAFNIIGQCLFYHLQSPLAELVLGPDESGTVRAERLAEHITRFSLAAVGLIPPLGQTLPPAISGPESHDWR